MKVRTQYNMPEIYKYYKDNYDAVVDHRVFRSIYEEYIKFFIQRVYEGDVVKLPKGLGAIQVQMKKKKYVYNEDGTLDINNTTFETDWGSTNKFWKEYPQYAHKKYIMYENEHTNGYGLRINWTKHGVSKNGIRNFYLKPVRSFSRGLAAYVKANNNITYYEYIKR